MAHAQAREAVHAPLDVEVRLAQIAALGLAVERVETAATRREVYMRRPDLGRRLTTECAERLASLPRDAFEVAIVLADGLSTRAVASNAAPLLARLLPKFAAIGVKLAPVIVAQGARGALGDEIGERPGLSSPDSLGAYITFAPRIGRMDAERNCVCDIRPDGLDLETASIKRAWLVAAAVAGGISGIGLKDESDSGSPPLRSEPAIDARNHHGVEAGELD